MPDRVVRSAVERVRRAMVMTVLRAFLALDLEHAFRRDALALIDELRGERLPRVRWVTHATMHVTLRFLGDTEETLVPALTELVTRLGETLPGAIELRSTSLLAFPSARRAHVLALHLDDDGVLTSLGAAVEQGVTTLGFSPEQRAFRPHLTLGRMREPADLRRLFAARTTPMAGGRLDALTLYKSELGKEAAVHTPLARFALGGDAVQPR